MDIERSQNIARLKLGVSKKLVQEFPGAMKMFLVKVKVKRGSEAWANKTHTPQTVKFFFILP